jgi:ABC-type uncharacterized transport system ATPase subunit
MDEFHDEDILRAKIRILNDKSTNEMISTLMQFGNIHAISEIIPTMNDIFIAKVSNDSLNYMTQSNLTE